MPQSFLLRYFFPFGLELQTVQISTLWKHHPDGNEINMSVLITALCLMVGSHFSSSFWRLTTLLGAAAMETPPRENQEPQEAASSDEVFFVEHLRFFFSNWMKMSSNAKCIKPMGLCKTWWHVTCSFLATGHADFEAFMCIYRSSQIGSVSS